MSQAGAVNKLMVLYFLDQADFPVTNGQLMEFFLDKQYLDFISLQEALAEMLEGDLLSSRKQSNRTEYTMTESGQQTLSFFKDRLSETVKKDIRDHFRENSRKMKNEVSVLADYYRTTNHDYAVRCRAREGKYDLIDLTVTVPTEVQAERSAIKWKENYEQIYAFVMKNLL